MVGGHTEHYQPFGLLDAVGIWLGVSECFPFCFFCFFDFVGGAVPDEDWFAAPFDDYLCELFRSTDCNVFDGRG